MRACEIQYRLLSILTGLIVALALLEFGAYGIQKFSNNYRLRIPLPPKKFYSKFEIPESLSSLPIIKKIKIPEPTWSTEIHMPLDEHDGLLLPPKNTSFEVSFTNKDTGTLLWKNRATTDEYRRRRAPVAGKSPHQHIVGFGCSLLWGHGVNDDETILAYLAINIGSTVTYNAAFEGYGPAENLIRIKNENSLTNISPSSGVGIYFYFPKHYARYLNSMKLIGSWRSNGLVLQENKIGEFTSIGRVDKVYPKWVLFSKWVTQDPLLKLFNFDWPIENQSDMARMARVLAEIEYLYKKNTTQKNKFVVVLLPSGDAGDLLRRSLDAIGIHFIDYSTVDLDKITVGPSELEGDGHFTPEANRTIAETLARDLKNID